MGVTNTSTQNTKGKRNTQAFASKATFVDRKDGHLESMPFPSLYLFALVAHHKSPICIFACHKLYDC